jgi:hypothetical protein
MVKTFASNTLLTFGIILLVGFCVVEFSGLGADPILPASAALCIGCTAVLDRIHLDGLLK